MYYTMRKERTIFLRLNSTPSNNIIIIYIYIKNSIYFLHICLPLLDKSLVETAWHMMLNSSHKTMIHLFGWYFRGRTITWPSFFSFYADSFWGNLSFIGYMQFYIQFSNYNQNDQFVAWRRTKSQTKDRLTLWALLHFFPCMWLVTYLIQ